jgi:hypothetical protein
MQYNHLSCWQQENKVDMDFFKNSGSYPEAKFLQGREADQLRQLIDFDYDEICDTYSETYAYYALSHNIVLKLASKLLTECKMSPEIVKLLNRGQDKAKHTPPLSDMNALLSFYIVYDAKKGGGAKTIAESAAKRQENSLSSFSKKDHALVIGLISSYPSRR